eukprot:9355801-Ditylum_brightwellii.AAC.1
MSAVIVDNTNLRLAEYKIYINMAQKVRAGSAKPAKQCAACQVLEVTSVIIGHDQDDYVKLIEQPLCLVSKGTHQAT